MKVRCSILFQLLHFKIYAYMSCSNSCSCDQSSRWGDHDVGTGIRHPHLVDLWLCGTDFVAQGVWTTRSISDSRVQTGTPELNRNTNWTTSSISYLGELPSCKLDLDNLDLKEDSASGIRNRRGIVRTFLTQVRVGKASA